MDMVSFERDEEGTRRQAPPARPCAPAMPNHPPVPDPDDTWPSDAERLCATARQALLTPRGRMALVLRLSALPPPLPRPHHRRIAATILEQAARLYDGEAFELPGGDLVLLCRLAAPDGNELHPAGLPDILARLLRADVPPTRSLTTLWDLEREGTALLAYTAALEG